MSLAIIRTHSSAMQLVKLLSITVKQNEPVDRYYDIYRPSRPLLSLSALCPEFSACSDQYILWTMTN